MIPKYLTLKGFFSYKTAMSIDFAPLSRAGLFGIFGKVGSGKSSILEAMMLALYGEVERIGSKQRNYNLMNLESDELLIEFEFEAGGKDYKSVVNAKRNKKNFEDVKTYKTTYYEKREDIWHTIQNFDAARIIGLKAEEFKKTIVIPQNTFQDFLRLGEADRTRMMRDLFNLEKYDLSPKVKKLNDQNDKNLEANHAKLLTLGTVTTDIIENQKLQIIDLEKNIVDFKKQIENLRQQEAYLKTLKTQFDDLKKQEQNAQILDEQADAMHTKAQQIRDLEYCQTHFKTPLEKLTDLQQQLAQTQKELAKKDKELKIKEKNLEEKNNALAILTPQYDSRANLRREAEELESLQKVLALNLEVQDYQNRIEKGKNLLAKQQTDAQQAQQLLNNLGNERQDLQEKLYELTTLHQVKQWFSIKNNFLKNIERIVKELNTHQEKIEGIEANKKRLISGVLPSVHLQVAESASIAEAILKIKAQREAGRKQSEQLDSAMQHLHHTQPLATLATTLTEGAPCPLCGSLHHPSVFDEARTRQQIQTITKQKKQLQKEDLTLENVERELTTDKANFNTHQEAKKRLQQERERELAALELHIQNFLWNEKYNSHNENLIDDAIKKALQWQKQLQKVAEQLKTEQIKLEKIQADILKYEKRLQVLNIELKEVETTQKNEMQRVQTVEAVDFWLTQTAEYLTEQARNRRETAEKVAREYEQLQKDLQKLERETNLLRGGIEALQTKHIENETKIHNVQNKINELVTASNFDDIKKIEQILQNTFDLEKARKEVSTYESKRYAQQEVLIKLREQLKDKTFDASEYKILLQSIKQIENNFNIFNQQLGEAKNKLSDFENRFAQIQLLQREREILAERAKNLEVLRGIFKGSAFVNYVSYIYMKNICDIANARFERFTQYRLRLALDKDNNFLICDLLNSGKTRSLQTLSGGQLFQASLALALALADSIQRLTKNKQNFFFLDEGFGSLDNDALQIVFDTLKTLRQENRVVGIISHVDAMQQEIEQYLRVWLDEKVGSRVAIEGFI